MNEKRIFQRIPELLAWTPPEGSEWEEKRENELDLIELELPSGSGFDSASTINREKGWKHKWQNCYYLDSAYHALSEHGYYIGWIHFTVRVEPAWDGFDLKVRGNFSDVFPNSQGERDMLRDYIGETFDYCLNQKWEYKP